MTSETARKWEVVVQLASSITSYHRAILSIPLSFGQFRGVKLVHTPAVWRLRIPSRVHVFLWFLSKSKILTRDNVAKRQALVDTTCLSCSDFESVHHLFFDCVVAKQMWLQLVHVVNLNKVYNFEAVAEFWLSERKHVRCCCNVELVET